MTKQQIINLQNQLNSQGANLKVDGIRGPLTKAAELKSEMAKDPSFSQYDETQKDALIQGMTTGDWSKVQGVGGKPFDATIATKAFNDNMAVLDPAYAAEKQKETLDIKDTLAGKQASYAETERKAAEDFQNQKTGLDQTAADQGVLFSGGRIQKQNNLKTQFDAEQAYNKGAMSRDINSTARDYAYKYGTDSANSLSKYYKLGGNSYNPNVATGGATSNGLSSIYNNGGANFYGTNPAKQKAETAVRAYGQLKNLTNKSVVGSYKDKL